MTHASQSRPILILGGTGKTGRRIVERLERMKRPVRIGSRTAAPPFEWTDRSTWGAALDRASAVYISYYPDLAVPGAEETVTAFIDLAVASGVRRLVLLSGRGEPEAQRAEHHLRRSGADWTIVRAAWFMQNFSESFMLDGVLAGTVALPADRVREPFVDADDIAEVAAAALTDDRHIGRLYEVTGPRLMTFSEAVAGIGKATGREIGYVPLPTDDYLAEARAGGVPEEFVLLLDDLFRNVLDGRNEYLADGVEEALGRKPRDFADYAGDTAASGVWRA